MVPLVNFDRSEIVITQIKRLGQSHLLTNFVKTNLPNLSILKMLRFGKLVFCDIG